MYTLFFVILVVCSIAMFVLAYLAFKGYRSAEDPEKLKAAITAVVAGLLILSINMVGVFPVVAYDSVRYMAELRGNETTTVILPFPSEFGFEDQLNVKRGQGSFHLVESEKGLGLVVVFGKYVYIEGYLKVRFDRVDYSAELDDGENFWVHLDTTYDPAWFEIYELRIIHQNPSDFHSKQIFTYKMDMKQGWNRIEWDIYRE